MFAIEAFPAVLQSLETVATGQISFARWRELRARLLADFLLPDPAWNAQVLSAIQPPPVSLADAADVLYVVGGAVRDAILGRDPDDIEYVVNWHQFPGLTAALEQRCGAGSQRIFAHARTAKISCGNERYEIAAMRQDEYDAGGILAQCSSAELPQDALRRDFTCNALYYCSRRLEIYDPFGWQGSRTLQQVMPGTLAEDPLRIVRMLRFAHSLTLTIDEATTTEAAMVCKTPWPALVHRGRIAAELNRAARKGVLGSVLTGLRELGWPMPVLDSLTGLHAVPEKSAARWAAKCLNEKDRLAFRNWLNL